MKAVFQKKTLTDALKRASVISLGEVDLFLSNDRSAYLIVSGQGTFFKESIVCDCIEPGAVCFRIKDALNVLKYLGNQQQLTVSLNEEGLTVSDGYASTTIDARDCANDLRTLPEEGGRSHMVYEC
jgi:hypothetical protein